MLGKIELHLAQRMLASLLAALLAVIPDISLSQVSVENRLLQDPRPLVAAHRNAKLGGFPENSLAGVAYAIERGIDMVHINSQLTGDGHYILMHDNTLNRTTNVEEVFPDGPPDGPTRVARGGKDYVRDYTLDQILQLRLTDGEDGGAHRVPTLVEALSLIDGRILVQLGLKGFEVDGLAMELAKLETDNVLLFDVFYYDYALLRDIADATSLPVAVSMTRSRDPISDIEKLAAGIGEALQLVIVLSDQLSPEFVAMAHDLGIQIGVSGRLGGEDSALEFDADPAPWLSILQSGMAVVTTAKPETVMQLLDRSEPTSR